MSTLQVLVVQIEDIISHPNADKLEVAVIAGWNCVVQKDAFKKGDIGVYFPIDSILPELLEYKIFGPDSKIVLHKHRVRTIKLRGAISQGLLVRPATIGLPEGTVGADLTEYLGVTKYEPPVPEFQKFQGRIATKKEVNPHFHKYTKIENIKNYKQMFEPEEDVVATEKIHGTNFRAGWVPFVAITWAEKIKKFFGFSPEWQFVFGSHNVQLQHKMLYDGFYEKNVYAQMVKKYDLEKKIPKGFVLYGEIYGDGIQKDYSYGLMNNQHDMVCFDIMKDGVYLNFVEAADMAHGLGIPQPPILYSGPFSGLDLEILVLGPSLLGPQKVREGAVIRSHEEKKSILGRKVLKAISPEYLLKDNTEFH